MNDQTLAIQLEGLLFALGRSVSYTELAKIFSTDTNTVSRAAGVLKQKERSGIVLVDDGTMLELRAAPEAAEVIERIRREEYSREIGKAGLETLAAIMYKGPLSRSDIDFIRGVNSSQTLRTLLMRGLVRRIPNPRDERSYLYEATTELYAQLGSRDTRDIEEYNDVKEKLTALEESYRAQQTQ
ncbi:MAG TPA: SMC-Scp complex subunit ScpB [Candidatus Paceibacterota bacterium]|nr:SMC-Scp complex subunit ScpB [Candidatus Paceibacterota bacterium]